MNNPLPIEKITIDDIDFEELEEKILSYPNRNDPAFQELLDFCDNEDMDDRTWLAHILILDCVVNGICNAEFNDAGKLVMAKPQHN